MSPEDVVEPRVLLEERAAVGELVSLDGRVESEDATGAERGDGGNTRTYARSLLTNPCSTLQFPK